VVTPLLNDFMARIRACEAAGGELRSITIATSADPGQSANAARAQIQRRQQRVREALVGLGAPADKPKPSWAGARRSPRTCTNSRSTWSIARPKRRLHRCAGVSPASAGRRGGAVAMSARRAAAP
jgi:hypothetical protein